MKRLSLLILVLFSTLAPANAQFAQRTDISLSSQNERHWETVPCPAAIQHQALPLSTQETGYSPRLKACSYINGTNTMLQAGTLRLEATVQTDQTAGKVFACIATTSAPAPTCRLAATGTMGPLRFDFPLTVKDERWTVYLVTDALKQWSLSDATLKGDLSVKVLAAGATRPLGDDTSLVPQANTIIANGSAAISYAGTGSLDQNWKSRWCSHIAKAPLLIPLSLQRCIGLTYASPATQERYALSATGTRLQEARYAYAAGSGYVMGAALQSQLEINQGFTNTTDAKDFVIALPFGTWMESLLITPLAVSSNPVEPAPPTTPINPGPVIGLPDPSAVYCSSHGGQTQTKKDALGNEYGVCFFPDGSSCPTWEFYGGTCQSGGGGVSPGIPIELPTDVCPMIYAPVCGKVQVQCVTQPCAPVDQTFSNSCVASAAKATDIRDGACGEGPTVPVPSQPTPAPEKGVIALASMKQVTDTEVLLKFSVPASWGDNFSLRLFIDGTVPESDVNVLKNLNPTFAQPSGIGKGKKEVTFKVPANSQYRLRAIAVHATDGNWTKNNTWTGYTDLSDWVRNIYVGSKPVTTPAEKTAFDATGVWEGEHVILRLHKDTAKLLNNPKLLVNKMDRIYEFYAGLMGGTPYNGEKIKLDEKCGAVNPLPALQCPWGYMVIHDTVNKRDYWGLSGNPVNIITGGMKSSVVMFNEKEAVPLGLAHEFGHDFDSVAPKVQYIFHSPSAEAWANLKSAYAIDAVGLPMELNGTVFATTEDMLNGFYRPFSTKYQLNNLTFEDIISKNPVVGNLSDYYFSIIQVAVDQVGRDSLFQTAKWYKTQEATLRSIPSDTAEDMRRRFDQFAMVWSCKSGQDLSPLFAQYRFPVSVRATVGIEYCLSMTPAERTDEAINFLDWSVTTMYLPSGL